ncbi:MAG: DUF1156 domain-containing protein, partial [Proteobacteria bacterium]|nr:DUF1156 domain-containing protein [Pseudomonadota bacterium]
PASDDPAKDREIYLKLLTMDGDGLRERRTKSIPAARLHELAAVPDLRGRGARHVHRSPLEKAREHWFETNAQGKIAWRASIDREQRESLTRRIFDRLSYDQKLEFCVRPEEIEGPSEAAWRDINAHLGTQSTSLPELVAELGKRRFGRVPRVGDAFCGGGSIPFEAARLGCDVYASDLNPVAALLTWGALNIVGGGPEVAKQVEEARAALFAAVDEQITKWGIEHNEKGWRADLYLYCYETQCPECGWTIPLSGSWVIGEKSGVVADLLPDVKTKTFRIDIREGASKNDLRRAKDAGTIKDGEMICPSPDCAKKDVATRIKVSVLRGDRREGGETVYGIRAWSENQVVAGADDLYHERLYCIRWLVPTKGGKSERVYRAPDAHDLAREKKAMSLLMERFDDWRAQGILPTMAIRPGAETRRIRRDLGATYWHHLFNPRQLLVLGTMMDAVSREEGVRLATQLLETGVALNLNSRITRWHPRNDQDVAALYTNAFAALYNYSCRSFAFLTQAIVLSRQSRISGRYAVETCDARHSDILRDLWITDPPYADAINYHELCDFFLAWYRGPLQKLFPEWHTDGRYALAVVGKDEQFRQSMADVYKNLAQHMPDNGMQVVMFTHNDAAVWADLCMILWAAGLQVTAAWCVSTETGSEVAHKDNG